MSVLYQLYAMLFEIDVSKEGVGGAKQFFEAKVKILYRLERIRFYKFKLQIAAIKDSDKFQREIRQEQEQRRQMEEEKVRRKLAFQHRLAQFQST